jgi:hypothetical protein
MRLPVCVLLAATIFAFSACGDDNSSQSTSGDRPAPNATAPGTGSTGQGSSGGQQGTSGDGKSGSAKTEGGGEGSGDGASTPPRTSKAERRRLRSRRPTRRGDFTGTNRTIYYEARSRCLTIPLRSLARSYGAASDSPQDAAEAYAKREAPTGRANEAAVAGCLDGINSKPQLAP